MARATPEGVRAYARRQQAQGRRADHFRLGLDGLALSSVGLGTYLGDPTPAVDAAYQSAIGLALDLGVNVIDTAVNYRFQRSERAIGLALAEAFAAGRASREEVFVSTKGGYISFDTDWPADPDAWIETNLVQPGIVRVEDIVEGHCMAPGYLAHQINQSRANLQLDCLDLYYLHNPEGQKPVVGAEEFNRRLALAFETFEAAVARGEIAAYGAATWTGFRQPPEAPDHLSLEEIVGIARTVAGDGHHFRAIQLPHNLAMAEAHTAPTQTVGGEPMAALAAAARLGVTVFASASLLQSRLARRLPESLRASFDGCETDGQRALQFVRSTPGITTALVGMSRPEHVLENLSVANLPPLDLESFKGLFRRAG